MPLLPVRNEHDHLPLHPLKLASIDLDGLALRALRNDVPKGSGGEVHELVFGEEHVLLSRHAIGVAVQVDSPEVSDVLKRGVVQYSLAEVEDVIVSYQALLVEKYSVLLDRPSEQLRSILFAAKDVLLFFEVESMVRV